MDEKEPQRRSKEDYYREIREGKAGHLGKKLSKAYSTFMREVESDDSANSGKPISREENLRTFVPETPKEKLILKVFGR